MYQISEKHKCNRLGCRSLTHTQTLALINIDRSQKKKKYGKRHTAYTTFKHIINVCTYNLLTLDCQLSIRRVNRCTYRPFIQRGRNEHHVVIS